MARNAVAPVVETLPSVEEQRAFTSKQLSFVDGRPTRAAYGLRAAGEQERGRSANPRYMQLVYAMEDRHQKTGISSVTIINMLPIPLVVNSPMASLRVVVPACPRGERFTMHTWDKADIQPLYAGEGVHTPWDFLPEQLAQAYIDEHRAMGGVCMIRASQEQILALGAEIENAPEYIDAKRVMHIFCHSKVMEAWNYYNTQNHAGAINIGNVHRACAHVLRDAGLLPQDPEWMEIVKDVDQQIPKCPVCKADPLRGASKCVCGRVLDPYAFYMAGECDENDPCLERLTRAQVEDLGISKYVAETVDEKPDRVKKGLPKPLSEAQLIMREIEEMQGANQQRAQSASGPDMSQV